MDIRLNKAKELGADLVINSMRDNVKDVVMDWTNGRRADIVLDASGSPVAIGQTESVVKSAGTIVLVGNPSGPMPENFNLQSFVNREITMKGVFRYRNVYPMAIGAVSSGILPVEKVPDRIYPFAESQQAFNDSIDHKAEIVKAVIAL